MKYHNPLELVNDWIHDKNSIRNSPQNFIRCFFSKDGTSAIVRLLEQPDVELVALGAWIASEFGEGGVHLLGAIEPFLSHPQMGIRYSALDLMHSCSQSIRWPQCLKVIAAIHDSEAFVRVKAMCVTSDLPAIIDGSALAEAVSEEFKKLMLSERMNVSSRLVDDTLASHDSGCMQWLSIGAQRRRKIDAVLWSRMSTYCLGMKTGELFDFWEFQTRMARLRDRWSHRL